MSCSLPCYFGNGQLQKGIMGRREVQRIGLIDDIHHPPNQTAKFETLSSLIWIIALFLIDFFLDH
jgi:hypothetical protein